MSGEQTKIVCKCGASIESRWTSEINDWQSRHDKCLNRSHDWATLADDEIKPLWPYTCFQESAVKFARDFEARLKVRNA